MQRYRLNKRHSESFGREEVQIRSSEIKAKSECLLYSVIPVCTVRTGAEDPFLRSDQSKPVDRIAVKRKPMAANNTEHFEHTERFDGTYERRLYVQEETVYESFDNRSYI